MTKKIERKIIKRVYQIETKKTVLEIFFKFFSIVFFGLVVFILSEIFFEILKEEKNLDFFQLFVEDFEVVKKYFFDTVYIFYLEIPKIILILFLFLLSILFYLIWHLIKNLSKIKNKVNSLIKFWRKKI